MGGSLECHGNVFLDSQFLRQLTRLISPTPRPHQRTGLVLTFLIFAFSSLSVALCLAVSARRRRTLTSTREPSLRHGLRRKDDFGESSAAGLKAGVKGCLGTICKGCRETEHINVCSSPLIDNFSNVSSLFLLKLGRTNGRVGDSFQSEKVVP